MWLTSVCQRALPGPKQCLGSFLPLPPHKTSRYVFMGLVLRVGWFLTAKTEQARKYHFFLLLFLPPLLSFKIPFSCIIFFIGLLSPKSWIPASMLCSCLYCCILSRGMGAEDAVFSVVGKQRPAILERSHRYTSSGFYSKRGKYPRDITR